MNRQIKTAMCHADWTNPNLRLSRQHGEPAQTSAVIVSLTHWGAKYISGNFKYIYIPHYLYRWFRLLKSFHVESKHLLILHKQYYDTRSQGINSHVTDAVLLEYSSFSTTRLIIMQAETVIPV